MSDAEHEERQRARQEVAQKRTASNVPLSREDDGSTPHVDTSLENEEEEEDDDDDEPEGEDEE